MTALTQDRATVEILGDRRRAKSAAAQTFFGGGIVMRNAAGFAVKGATALNLRGIGRTAQRVLNPGAAGDQDVEYEAGIFRYWATGTAFTDADIGKVCFVVDDQTVAKDNGTNTRSPAGFVYSVEDGAVFVEFDESKLLVWIAAQA